MMFIAATCPKALLNNNYTFLQAINFWPPIVFIGIFFSSFSAALSSLIGASRVLHAMAKDGMFGPALRLVKKTNSKGNPYVAVVVTWFLIQIVLLIGKLNAIAPLVTIFFLLAYTACDLACLGLDWASAPNFRPTFKYFSWHTALLGVISTMAVMFLVNYIWALAAMAIMIILSAISHYTAPQVAWGSISQALIFHQVRKYALKMNVQDSSIDSWRPGILYLVKDITASVEGLLFVNDLKKSGLLVLGHVNLGSIDEEDMESSKRKLNAWYDFVKKNQVKAFVEHTTCPDLRLGAEQLLRLSGLGGMKANTLVMNIDSPTDSTKDIITDAIRLDRNVVLMKNVTSFNRNLLQGKNDNFIDIWPTSLTSPGFMIGTVDSIKADANAQFLLQLGCLLSRSHSWKPTAKLRIFIPVAPGTDVIAAQKSFKNYFMELRITAVLVLVTVEYDQLELMDDDYVSWVNSLILSKKSGQTGITFLQLPNTVDTCMGFISPEKGSGKIFFIYLFLKQYCSVLPVRSGTSCDDLGSQKCYFCIDKNSYKINVHAVPLHLRIFPFLSLNF